MIKKYSLLFLVGAFATSSFAQKVNVEHSDVERIIKTLAADDMQGRASFTPGIDKAAKFIENEFRQIGLQPLSGESGFRQTFNMYRIQQKSVSATLNGKSIATEHIVALSDKADFKISNADKPEVILIPAGQQFAAKYREVIAKTNSVIALVDPSYAEAFGRYQRNLSRQRTQQQLNDQAAKIFIMTDATTADNFEVTATSEIKTMPLFNVAGMIPGKSREKELVVFSAHYDHIGIQKAVNQDSIANGADDDASGTTAVIALAKHYKKLNNNERTLIFVAFTSEEIGGYGSRYFSSKLNPDDVVAMFNIEMIGKDSKFGVNTAFITGYERSDFGTILQKNLEGTDFKFHPDPYPEQNLFYRSDNATLAALGVPAHTISTVQIDTDKLYHTVDDEFESLDVNNITATIKAIALSARSIIAGKDTPTRIPKLPARN